MIPRHLNLQVLYTDVSPIRQVNVWALLNVKNGAVMPSVGSTTVKTGTDAIHKMRILNLLSVLYKNVGQL